MFATSIPLWAPFGNLSRWWDNHSHTIFILRCLTDVFPIMRKLKPMFTHNAFIHATAPLFYRDYITVVGCYATCPIR